MSDLYPVWINGEPFYPTEETVARAAVVTAPPPPAATPPVAAARRDGDGLAFIAAGATALGVVLAAVAVLHISIPLVLVSALVSGASVALGLAARPRTRYRLVAASATTGGIVTLVGLIVALITVLVLTRGVA